MRIPKQLDNDQCKYKNIEEVMEIFKSLLIINEVYMKVPIKLRDFNNEDKAYISEWYFRKVIEFLTKTERGNETLNKLRYLVSTENGCHLSVKEIMKEL